VALIEQACDQVGADEAASGLAEAAMNSFRLAHGMFTEFIYVDRGLAKRLHEKYGDGVTKLAEYFLGSRPSKIGLICDVLACVSGVPDRRESAQRVAIQVPVAALSPASAPVSPSVAVLDPARAQESSRSVQEAPKPPLTSDGKMRPDGVGALGTGDIYALTDDDHKAVPRERPRGAEIRVQSGSAVKGLLGETPAKGDLEYITAEQWRIEFDLVLQAWLGQRPS
jgi:hypothetical protein